MYKTQTESFLLGESLSISVLKEKDGANCHYAFLKIGLFGFFAYAVCAMGEDYALECLGGDALEAERFFELLVSEGVSPLHMFDIVSDHRRRSLLQGEEST